MTNQRDPVVTIDSILLEALSWEGTPYHHQAACKGYGCDCLGLIRGVYGAFWPINTQLPVYSPDWAEAGGGERLAEAATQYLVPKPIEKRSAGDVLLFRYRPRFPAKHAGILIDDNHFLHAQHNSVVARASLSDWWARRIAFVFSFPIRSNAKEIHR